MTTTPLTVGQAAENAIVALVGANTWEHPEELTIALYGWTVRVTTHWLEVFAVVSRDGLTGKGHADTVGDAVRAAVRDMAEQARDESARLATLGDRLDSVAGPVE